MRKEENLAKEFSAIHFQFPQVSEAVSGSKVEICLAFLQRRPGPELVPFLFQDQAEYQRLQRRITHPERLEESVLARIARGELERRGVSPAQAFCSYTHTRAGDWIAAGASLASFPTGLDLEHADRPIDESIQDRILTKSEKSELSRLGLIEIWCARESLAKALGTGLRAPLVQYETRLEKIENDQTWICFSHFPDWQARIFRTNQWVVALCLPR